MAVILPGKFVFLATPLTGSVATAEALRKIPGIINAVDKRRDVGHYATLQEVRATFGDVLQGTEVVFTSVRNPYDVCVSWYIRNVMRHHRKHPHRRASDPGFLEFLRRWASCDQPPCIVGGSMFAPATSCRTHLRYERLQVELNSFLRKLPGVPSSAPLHPANLSPDKKHWSLYHDAETYEYINDRFRDDIVRFGYQFLWR